MDRTATTVLFLLALTVGCDDSLQRQPLSGTVTYQQQPVPRGTISFRPDRTRGGKGPAGFAQIIDGEFSTRESGKGAMAGPIEVAIEGYASPDPYAPPLFPPHKMAMDISDENDRLEIEVPKTKPPKWFRQPSAKESKNR